MGTGNNDTSYMDISDIIGYKYTPINKITPETGRQIMEKLGIDEDTDTVITGSFSDWVGLVCFIHDKLTQYQEDDPSECEFDLSYLKPTPYQDDVMSQFLGNMITSIEGSKIPDVIKLKGSLDHYNRLYQFLREIDLNRTNDHRGE